MTNPSKLKIAIIGLGNQSLSDHIPTVLKNEDVELNTVYDPSKEAIDKFKSQFSELSNKVTIAEGLSELEGIDAAIVAVPHCDYYEIVKYLCDKNIRIFKEKPLARNLSEFNLLMALPNFGNNCFVSTQRRFNPLYLKAKDAMKNIGQIYMFNATYKLNIPNPNEGWRGDLEMAGGGCMLDMGYHLVDQLLWWFGMPQRVFAATSCLAVEGARPYAEDSASIAFSYPEGLHGCITLSRSAGEKFEQYTIHGSGGSIIGNKKTLVIKNKTGTVLEQMEVDSDSKMLDAQFKYFVETVKKGEGFYQVIKRNAENLKFIERCYLIAKGKTQT